MAENNPYLELARADVSGKLTEPGKTSNPYMRLAQEDVDDNIRKFNQTIAAAVQTNPEMAAEAQKLGGITGVPADVAERNLEQLRKLARQKYIEDQRLMAQSPILARQMRDLEFAKIAQDQTESLTKFESLWRGTKDFFDVTSIPEAIATQYEAGRLKTERGFIGEATLSGRISQEEGNKKLGSIDEQLSKLRAGEKTIFGETAGVIGQQAPVIIGQLTYAGAGGLTAGGAGMLAGPGAPVSVPTLAIGGFFAGLLAKRGADMYAIEGGNAYADMIKDGISHSTARNVSVGVGLVNAALETVGASTIAAPLKKALVTQVTEEVTHRMLTKPTVAMAVKTFGKEYGASIAGELVTEQLQELSSFAGEEIARSIDKPGMQLKIQTPEGRAELATRLGDVFESTLKGMILLGGVGPTIHLRSNYAQAKAAERDVNFIQSLTTMSTDNVVRERNATAFEKFVSAQAEGSNAENIYIDGEQVARVLAQGGITIENLEKVSPEIAAQVKEAAQTGGDVVLPTAKYAAHIAGTDLGNALMPHMRLAPDAMSAAELKEFQQNKQAMMAEAKALLDESTQRDDNFIKEAKAIESEIFTQIKGAKIYTDKVARNYSEFVRDFVVTQAAKANMMPSEFYNRYMYKVESGFTGAKADLFDQNQKVQTWSQTFKNWFGKSVFQNEQGAPVMLYHGTADDVTQFDVNHPGRKDSGWLGTGVYLTDSADMADLYAMQKRRTGQAGENVMPLYARLENPYYATAEDKARVRAGGREAADAFTAELQAQGHDGVIYQVAPDAREIVVFDPAGVKSPFNDGTWSRENADILAQQEKMSRGDVTQHQMLVERGARAVGQQARFSEAERAAIDKAAKEAGVSKAEIERQVRDHKLAHPTKDGWAPLEFTGVTLDDNGGYELKYKAVAYQFDEDANGKVLKPGTPEYEKRTLAIAKRIRDEVLGVYERAQAGDKNAANIIRQAGWYKEMRSRLRQEFGGLGDLFADLLGATSPNTPVRGNWENAVDLLRRASRGDFDEMMPKWVEWSNKLDAAETEFAAWFGEQVQSGLSKKAIKQSDEYQQRYAAVAELRKLPEELMPHKESGAKYGFNGKNAVRAMLNLWRVVRDPNADIGIGGTAPKALNFSGNLIGFREKATIDVWAARLLQRLAGKLRIPSMAEASVSGKMLSTGETTLTFGFGQEVFNKAVKEIRKDPEMSNDKLLKTINDDDLQAIVWFLEKEVWTKNDWTSAAGEGGSFEYEADLTGQRDQERIKELRRIADSGAFATEEQKAAAQAETDALVAQRAAAREQRDAAKKAGDKKATNAAIKEIKELDKAIGRQKRILDAPTPEIVRQRREEALAELNTLTRTVDRYTGGLSIQQSMETQGIDFVPSDADMAMLGEDIKTSVYEADDGATVLGSKVLSTEGRYGAPERSLDLEVITRSGFDPTPMWLKMLTAAQQANQDSTFLSRVLRHDEAVDFSRHRPGVEIYFREAGAIDTLQPILTDLAKQGVEFYTVIVDGKRNPEAMAGAMPAAVGVRLQYVPEMNARYGLDDFNWSDLTVEEISTKMKEQADLLHDLADQVTRQVEGVSFAGQFWYETEVAFRNQYQEKIDAITNRTAEGRDIAAGGKGWAGESVLDGVKNAARWARESEQQGTGEGAVQPGSESAATDGTGAAINRPGGEAGGGVLAQGATAAERAEFSRREAAQRAGQFAQPTRGGFDPKRLTTILNEKADYSTFLHETAHFFLTVYADMASQPNATQQMKDDMQTVLDWFGVKDLETWNNMSLEEQRKYHEQWAYNYEIYLFEGKAPSVKLQTMFEKFSAFLRRVYKSIRDELNELYKKENGTDLPILTGEVRDVMDRMLASEEQISQAEQVRQMIPTFATQEQSGMDDATWAAYQEMAQQAHEQAVTDLTKASARQVQWLNNARSRYIKEMQRKHDALRKKIRDEVTEEVNQLPIYVAMEWLKRGNIKDENGNEIHAEAGHKLSLAEVKALFPESKETLTPAPDISKLGYGKYGMLAEEGLHPDMVAAMPGIEFQSGEALVRALIDAKPIKEAIDERVDQRMLEEHGELSDPVAMERAIELALHNEARARFVAVELRFIAKATAPVRVMMNAAKQVARQIIGSKKIKEIKPRDYSMAEARASKDSAKFSKKGETEQAAKAKQNQLIQNQLAAEAVAAQAEVEKALNSFKKLFRSDEKMAKSRDMDLIDAARTILAYHGIGRQTENPSAYIKKLEQYNPDLYAEIEPLINRARDQGIAYDQLTLDEFRALRDTVESLWYQSTRNNQMMVEGKVMQLDEIEQQLNTRLEAIGIPAEVAGERQAPTDRDKAVRLANSGKALLRRIEHWADSMDGARYGKNGDLFGAGPFTKYIWRPISQALDAYRIERNKYVKRYSDMISKLDLPVGKIEAPELNYTFGSANGGIGKAELLGALLHTGNQSNLKKLLVGRGWGEINADGSLNASRWTAFVQRMYDEGRITKADMDFVQEVWDLNEEMKPLAQKAHHDIFGYYFKEVEADSVSTPFGVYRGGYVPAKTDSFIVRDAQRNAKMEELEADFRNSMPSTGLGFTKGRVEYNKPLSLDIRVMTKHIDDVIRFAMVQPAVKDVLKLVRRRDFADNVTRIDPTAIEDMILPWLNRSARQITTEPGYHKGVDAFWAGVRSRTGVAIMFMNLTNAMQQLTGHFVTMTQVKGSYLKTALVSYMTNTQGMTEDVAALSPFMANRLENQMFDIQDNINQLLLNPSRYEKVQKWAKHHGYFLQTAFQNQVDVVAWSAKYNQTLAEAPAGMSDKDAIKEAVAQADAVVRKTQSSLNPEDISAFEVGSPFYKTLIQFSGYFNMLANLNGTEFKKIFRDLGWRGSKGKIFMQYMLGFALPMLVADAIVRSLGGGWDDDDHDGYLDVFMDWFFGSQIKGAAALLPFGTNLLVPFNSFNNKPYDDKMTTSPSVSTLEASTVGVVKAGINIVDPGKEVTGKNVRDILTLLSLITGIPLTVLGRPIGYEIDVERGKVAPTSTADYVRGLITGKASGESVAR